MTPQMYLDEAACALDAEDYPRATALAATGVLSLLIGAAEGLVALAAPS